MRYSSLLQQKPIHLWFGLFIWDFFKNINLSVCSQAFFLSLFVLGFFFYIFEVHGTSAQGLKCQMQMQVFGPLLLFFSFFYCVIQSPLNPAYWCRFLPGDTTLRCHSLPSYPSLCLSTSTAAQRPHCLSHNKVLIFAEAACLILLQF